MKPNIVLIIISVLIAALIGYGFYAANSGETNVLLLTFGSGICLALALTGALGIKFERAEAKVTIAVTSGIFFIVFLISNLIFAFTKVVPAPYIIVNGILLLMYILICYGLSKANK